MYTNIHLYAALQDFFVGTIMSNFKSFIAGESAHFEVQFVEKPGLVVWLKDNKPLEDKLADRVVQTEAAMNSYRLDIKNCR